MTGKQRTLVFDRASFIAWAEGILLDFSKGRGVVGDDSAFEEAEDVLEAGGVILLTVKGEPVTRLALEDGVFAEKALEAVFDR